MDQPKDDDMDVYYSKAIEKYSVVRPINFRYLPPTTSLNFPLSNYGRYLKDYFDSDSFSSFRIADMFMNSLHKMDIVSDAKNIKQLLKIAYSNQPVSIVVHRVENTFFLDAFDVKKNLIERPNERWKWMLNDSIHDIIVNSGDTDETSISHNDTLKKNCLNTNFLAYSFTHSLNPDDAKWKPGNLISPKLPWYGSPLPLPTSNEKYPDHPNTHQFNQYMSWNFENVQMLIGSELQIYKDRNCSKKNLILRDISQEAYISTVVDDWLDNLMCEIPEFVVCYHLNGMVQKYESVKTEDLPTFSKPTFSPRVIKHFLQKILNFLKSKVNNVGHTYLLFKGENNAEVILSDLTVLCSKSSTECENPFKIPVAMLLYRYAHNLCYTPNNSKMVFNPISIQLLLLKCLESLVETKYPVITTYIYYMLSDLYIPVDIDLKCLKLERLFNLKSLDDLKNDCQNIEDKTINYFSVDELFTLNKSKNKQKKGDEMTHEDHCKNALHYVGRGLNSLKYINNFDPKFRFTDKIYMEKRMHKSNIVSKPISEPRLVADRDEKMIKKKGDNKSNESNEAISFKIRKCSVKTNIVLNNNDYDQIFFFQSFISKTDPIRLRLPNIEHGILWKQYLRSILLEKARLSYYVLAHYELKASKFGKALKHFHRVYSLQRLNYYSSVDNDLFLSNLLKYCGDCYAEIRKLNINQFEEEPKNEDNFDSVLRKILDDELEDWTNEDLKSIYNYRDAISSSNFDLLEKAVNCYERSLETNSRCEKTIHLIANLYYEGGKLILDEHASIYSEECDSTAIKLLLDKSLCYFSKAINKYESIKDTLCLPKVYESTALVYMKTFTCLKKCTHFYDELSNNVDYCFKAEEFLMKGLTTLGNRQKNLELWDRIQLNLSTVFYAIASEYEPYLIENNNDKITQKTIGFQLIALKYCELENSSFMKAVHDLQRTQIYQRSRTIYLDCFNRCNNNNSSISKSMHDNCFNDLLNYSFLKLKFFLRSFGLFLKNTEVNEIRAINTENKVELIKSEVRVLNYCVDLLKSVSDGHARGDEFPEDYEGLKDDCLKDLETQLEYILKRMIKPFMLNRTTLAGDQLKSMYAEVLEKKKNNGGNFVHLLDIAIKITTLKLL